MYKNGLQLMAHKCKQCNQQVDNDATKLCRKCHIRANAWHKTEEAKAYRREYQYKRRQEPLYKLMHYTRKRLASALKQKQLYKNCGTKEWLGCSAEEYKTHIESQFEDGMTWDNYGNGDDQWSIDHIYPLHLCATVEEIKKASHYTNLRPLWHKDNLSRTYDEFA